MALQTLKGRTRAESAEDIETWLTRMTGCPQVTRTSVLRCDNPAHGDDAPNWFYVEADAAEGVARHRCIGCGKAVPVLDSEAHWTHPATWSCSGCGNCIVEIVAGVAEQDGTAHWLALAVRCVECGCIEGVTDLTLSGLPVDEVLAAL